MGASRQLCIIHRARSSLPIPPGNHRPNWIVTIDTLAPSPHLLAFASRDSGFRVRFQGLQWRRQDRASRTLLACPPSARSPPLRSCHSGVLPFIPSPSSRTFYLWAIFNDVLFRTGGLHRGFAS